MKQNCNAVQISSLIFEPNIYINKSQYWLPILGLYERNYLLKIHHVFYRKLFLWPWEMLRNFTVWLTMQCTTNVFLLLPVVLPLHVYFKLSTNCFSISSNRSAVLHRKVKVEVHMCGIGTRGSLWCGGSFNLRCVKHTSLCDIHFNVHFFSLWTQDVMCWTEFGRVLSLWFIEQTMSCVEQNISFVEQI